MKITSIGIENFKEMIDKNDYYVDKTKFISDIMNEYIVVFTRPRRFGKTLNMSMLYYFYSNKEIENAYLFHNLEVSQNQEIMKHQNQYPTIFITLKDMKNMDINNQMKQYANIVKNVVLQNKELLDSQYVDESDKRILNDLRFLRADEIQLKNALMTISRCLMNHYHKKVIILIDEYDVPLQSAYTNNYYDEMVDFLRSVFSAALKTNDALEKGVMTGCLRIAKESIFTGLNNFKVRSIMDNESSDCFGFTQKEIDQLLLDYDLMDKKDKMQEWYDGYLFGNTEIYNPWSALMFVDELKSDRNFNAVSFWANTSGNELVVSYIKNADDMMYDEFEQLMQGKPVTKYLELDLTYNEMDNQDNVYSFLLLTRYLKVNKKVDYQTYELVIPNREVYEIYRQSFAKYFKAYTKNRKIDLYKSLINGDAYQVNTLLNEILMKSISYYDNQENFYHGFLVGMFSNKNVESNKESGDGRFDLCILPNRILETVIVVECKHSVSDDDLIEDATLGARQIIEKRYLEDKRMKKYSQVIGYGISFYKKQCYVVKAQD